MTRRERRVWLLGEIEKCQREKIDALADMIEVGPNEFAAVIASVQALCRAHFPFATGGSL
jgi:hypothetical protein